MISMEVKKNVRINVCGFFGRLRLDNSVNGNVSSGDKVPFIGAET